MHVFLLVLYKKKLEESSTYNTLIKMTGDLSKNVSLIIWDNSPLDLSQNENSTPSGNDFLFKNLTYIKNGHNEKLSTIYNTIAEKVFSEKENKYLTILDHDSELPIDFHEKIISTKTKKCYLIIPRVMSNKTLEIISPRYQKYDVITYKSEVISNFKKHNQGVFISEKVFAVGSGMTISSLLWKYGPRFEDELSFYGVDTEYCSDYAKRIDSFYLIDIIVKHDISYESQENSAVNIFRFNKRAEHRKFMFKKYGGYSGFINLIYYMYVDMLCLLYKLKNKI